MQRSDNKKEDTKFIQPETIKRLARDVRQLNKSPLTSNGIYYRHDEDNILKGYAMIIGPQDTLYENGFYFFAFDYPHDYPSTPPKVTFRTNQDKVRFNPNLYTSGKVCISLLNTWRGEQWTACQSISTILLTLCTLLTNEPLLNEPGVQQRHRDFKPYNRIIEYENINIAIFNIIDKSPSLYLPWFDMFYDDALNNFTNNLPSIRKNIENIVKRNKHFLHEESNLVTANIYRMTIPVDYNNIITRFNNMFVKYSTAEQLTSWVAIPTIDPPIIKKRTHEQDDKYKETMDLLDQLTESSSHEKISSSSMTPPIPPTPKKITTTKHSKIIIKKKLSKKDIDVN